MINSAVAVIRARSVLRKKLMSRLLVTASATRPMWARTTAYAAASASIMNTGPATVPPGRSHALSLVEREHDAATLDGLDLIRPLGVERAGEELVELVDRQLRVWDRHAGIVERR